MRLQCAMLCACLLAPPAVQARGDEPDLPPAADQAIRAGDWEALVRLLKPLATGAEPSEPVRYWYGAALHHRGQQAEAVKHLSAALKANPRCRTAARYLAMASYKARSMEAAEAAAKAFPDDPVVLRELGRNHIRLFMRHRFRSGPAEAAKSAEHLAKAGEALQTSVAVDPTDTSAQILLGRVLHRLDRHEAAIRHLLTADRLGPIGYDAYALLAECYSWTRDQDRAASAYGASAAAAPTKAIKADWDRGVALSRAGRHDEAVEVFRDIFRRDHAHTKVRLRLAEEAYEAGDYALALFAFRESFRMDGQLKALVGSARCAYRMGQNELAVKLVNQAVQAGKEREKQGRSGYIPARAYFVRGKALWRLGRKKEAAVDLEKAVKEIPSIEEFATWAVYAFRQLDDPFGVIRVARLHGLAGHETEALKVLGQVPRIWPQMRMKDLDGKSYMGGHPRRTYLAIADIYVSLGHFRSAWLMCQVAGYAPGRFVSSLASWTALRGGDRDQAEKMFRVLAERGRNAQAKRDGHNGLAYLALLQRDVPAARTHLQALRATTLWRSAQGALKWAAVYAGDDPAAAKLDALDLLGIYGLSFQGKYEDRGVYVQGLLPGAALAGAYPPLRPKDVILRVGHWRLEETDDVKAFRKAPVPAGSTRVLVRRNKRRFEVTVDIEAARAAAARLSKGKGQENTQ